MQLLDFSICRIDFYGFAAEIRCQRNRTFSNSGGGSAGYILYDIAQQRDVGIESCGRTVALRHSMVQKTPVVSETRGFRCGLPRNIVHERRSEHSVITVLNKSDSLRPDPTWTMA